MFYLFYLPFYLSDLVPILTVLGLGIRSDPRIYAQPPAHVFVGKCCTFIFPSCVSRFLPMTTVSYQTAEIKSKHGLILDCSLQITNTPITSTAVELLIQWARSFHQGKRYGFLHEVGQEADFHASSLHLRCERILDVKAWLEDEVQCNLDSTN